MDTVLIAAEEGEEEVDIVFHPVAGVDLALQEVGVAEAVDVEEGEAEVMMTSSIKPLRRFHNHFYNVSYPAKRKHNIDNNGFLLYSIYKPVLTRSCYFLYSQCFHDILFQAHWNVGL